jgi:predicted MFS family arabinose efflux permease
MRNPWTGLKNLPREVWILAVAVFINRAGTMVVPFLVLYLTTSLHFSIARAGSIVAVYGVGALITAPLSGKLTDRYGTLRIMRLSLLLSMLVLFLFPLAHTVPAVFVATFLLAITTEMFRPASMAVVGHYVKPEQRKAAFALIRLSINLGMSIGPAIAGFLARSSFLYLFVVDGSTTLAGAIVLILFRFGSPIQATRVDGEPQVAAESRRALSHREFLYFLLSVVLISTVFFQHMSSLALFMVKNLKLSEAVYGSMFSINTAIIVLLEVPLNLSTTHWSHRRTLMTGALLFAVGFGILAFAHGLASVVVSVFVWTFGEMILFPGMASYVAQIASPDRQGEYMGFYTMAFGVAFIVGPWLGTALLGTHGPFALWTTMFTIGILSVLILWRLPEPQRAYA